MRREHAERERGAASPVRSDLCYREAMRRYIALLLLPALLSCATSTEAGRPDEGAAEATPPRASAEEAPPTGQLPNEVVPLRYDLDLTIVPAERRFSGRVAIAVEAARSTERIWLHGQNLEVESAAVVIGERRVPATFTQRTDSGVAALEVEEPVGPGPLTLELVYNAPFDEQLKGLYRVEEGGHAYAFTQFESHFARLAFPSFDEPRFKTPFAITVRAHAGDTVITATRETAAPVEGPDGLATWTFAETPPLPTYLIAFAVGPLDVVEVEGGLPPNEIRKEALPFRGIAAKGKGPRLKYALEHTGPILSALENYFGEPHPFSKLDVIAVPDFSAGAMENVGAVTFREYLLLVDEKTAPITQKQAFAAVMAHELAHMWFGNIVTMPWWDDIWLNEAFATWMAYKVVDQVHPSYEMQVGLKERVLDTMGYDSLTSARQIRQPIESDHDIRNAFDSITYSKGGGVLSMFERWLGEETFRDGIRRYLEKHRYGSATYADLLSALSEAAEKDVKTPFESFLFQPGVPLVDVDVRCEAGQAPTLEVRQQRYLPLGSALEAEKTWKAPVCVRFAVGKEQKQQCVLVEEASVSAPLEAERCPSWVVPNADGAGYYRWSLTPGWLDKLPFEQLPVKERLDYADSLRAAFAAGRIDAEEALKRLGPVAKDRHRAVAVAALPVASYVVQHLVPETASAEAKAWARQLYRPAASRLGYAPKGREEPNAARLRGDVLAFLALSAEDTAAQERLASLGRAWLAGEKKPVTPPELLPAALKAAVRAGDARLFDEMVSRLKATDDAHVRGLLLDALGAALEPELAKRARQLTLDPALRGNEALRPLGVQLSQAETRADAWRYLEDHWAEVLAVVPTTRQGSLPWLAASFCRRSDAERVRAFLGERIEGVIGGPRNLAGALEAIELCAARTDAQRESALRFLGGGQPSRP